MDLYVLYEENNFDAVFLSFDENEVWNHWRVKMLCEKGWREFCIKKGMKIVGTMEEAEVDFVELDMDDLMKFGFGILKIKIPEKK